MLVLSRNKGESVVIGNDVVVRIIDVYKGTVRLGIEAPKEVVVDRLEVREMKLGRLYRMNDLEEKGGGDGR